MCGIMMSDTGSVHVKDGLAYIGSKNVGILAEKADKTSIVPGVTAGQRRCFREALIELYVE